MSHRKMDIYLGQFFVPQIGNVEDLSKKLYRALLNKFMIDVSFQEYNEIKQYQECIFDLVEDLREKDISFIGEFLNYLDNHDPYLADNTIMIWSLPRTDDYLSKKFYNKKYEENIKKYNCKLVELVEHPVVKNFCIETLSKTNYVPVHCIDILWFYMNILSFELFFYNTNSCYYLGFVMPEKRGLWDEYIEFGLNVPFILEMGLGNVDYLSKKSGALEEVEELPRGTFKHFIKKFFTSYFLAEKMVSSRCGKNYFSQLRKINDNPSKYFGEKPFTDVEMKKLSMLLN